MPDLTETSSVVQHLPTGDFSVFLSTVWGLAAALVVQLTMRYGLLLVGAMVVASGATEGTKKVLRDYVRAHYTARPWWYRGVLFFLPPVYGTVFGALMGRMELSDFDSPEGALAGLCAGFSASVVFRLGNAYLQRKGIKLSEETSQDLTLQPMRAIRSDVPTDPVVVESSTSDVPTDRIGGKEGQ